MFRKTAVAFTFVVILSLLIVSVASAITITVDGIREAAWNGSGGQTPGSVKDRNEPQITDGYDIDTFQWTNDHTNMYFLVSTYADTIRTGNPQPTIFICLNTDNSTATGGTYANCNNMTGIDRSIEINLSTPNNSTVRVYNGPPLPATPFSNAGAYATQTTITEVAVPVNLLFAAGVCPGTIPTVVYFDNGITDPDDNVPDRNTFNINCGNPTAVTLSSLQAQPTTSPILPVALVGASAAALIGIVFLTRRGRKKSA